MKTSLQLKMNQQLTMTPQLQQAIRFLQLSSLELQQEIQQALETNPLLELSEDSDDFEDDPEEHKQQDFDADQPNDHIEDTQVADHDWNENIPVELAIDSTWDDVFQNTQGTSGQPSAEDFDFDAINGTQTNLKSHLEWQLNLTPMSDIDRWIGNTIIDAIDERGYLSQPPENLLDGIQAQLVEVDYHVDLDEFMAVLHLIHLFDPVGVGASDLSECLCIQLKQLAKGTQWRQQAIDLISKHIDLLASHDYALLRRRSGLKGAGLQQTIELITSLNPEPGSAFSSPAIAYVIPDILVQKRQDTWQVSLNPETTPKVRINQHYAALSKSANAKDNKFIKDNLQEANWFINSLSNRSDTLLRVAGRICEIQQGFLEHGEEAMKPLVLGDIADHLGLHESTISRAAAQKFMHTPRGIFELKYFFSSHVATASGGAASSTAIRALIKKFVADEQARKPLSDNKLTRMLQERGIQVARRTVAKYRESMNIPPTNKRKNLT